MTTAIPLTVFNQIIQTNSSPETIAALLNEAENMYSSTLKKRHGNARRVYPFWKICQGCSKPYPCFTKEQATRNKTCGQNCPVKPPHVMKGKEKKPPSERMGKIVACTVCGKEVWKPDAWLRKVKNPMCSRQCNGKVRAEALKGHAHKGRTNWTHASYVSYRAKMSGENNPAWKGGVTYFKTHGNYSGVKYIRCPAEFLSMARKDGYVMEHRILVAQAMGRCLLRTEVVHHVNHDPTDNRLENLRLFANNTDHKKHEHHGTPLPIWSL